MRHRRMSMSARLKARPTRACALLAAGFLWLAGAHGLLAQQASGTTDAAKAKPATASPAANPAKAGSHAQSRGSVDETRESLDAILKEVATYDGGIESAAMWKLRDYVYARKDSDAGRAECETKLLAFLKTTATPPAKMAACKYLRIVGSERAVPALQAMVADERSADMALYALQKIPGGAVDKALAQLLPKVTGATRTAVIGALGQRGSSESVSALTPLLGQPEFARAAAFALATIADAASADALAAAYDPAPSDLKAVLASAMLRCAEKAHASKNDAAALRLYDHLALDSSLPLPLRRAAAMGRISTAGADGPKRLLEYLQSTDVAMQEAAIARLQSTIAPDSIAQVCTLLPRLPDVSQVKLLAALTGYPADKVLPAILERARSGGSVEVRVAALHAIESTGDASVVPSLAETAAATKGPEQEAARSALALVKGRPADDAVVSMLAQKPADAVQVELLLAIAERRIFAAKTAAAAALGSPSPRVRIQAMKSLRAVGTPSDIPAVLDVLVTTEDEAERTEAGQTTAALAQKMGSAEGRARIVRARLMAEKDSVARARLFGVLALIGDNSSLPLLRAALEGGNEDLYDAAVRALASWPTSAAREDVLALARDSRHETHRLLAIQGLVRIIALDEYREPDAAVADLRQAAAFSWRPEEQRLVLGALPQFACPAALDLANGFLRVEAVKSEAQAAIDQIKERMAAPRRPGTH